MDNENTALLRRWFDEVWEQQREASIDQLAAPGFESHGMGPQTVKGSETFKAMRRAILGVFHDIRFNFTHTFADGKYASGLCEVTMVHTATGKPVRFLGNVVVRVEAGRIAEGWNTFNFLDLLEQVDSVPADSFGKMLAQGTVV